MEVEEIGTVKNTMTDADVGVVRDSYRIIGGSEMQLSGWNNVREFKENIETQIIQLNVFLQNTATLKMKLKNRGWTLEHFREALGMQRKKGIFCGERTRVWSGRTKTWWKGTYLVRPKRRRSGVMLLQTDFRESIFAMVWLSNNKWVFGLERNSPNWIRIEKLRRSY